ncbi:single-stranded DNA-binding protein [Cloacibacillus sp. An23]|uniref:single-stranded DNA-binding protein n=1 Tax=Cloacibacillus sp. An23 TaxID=1965591 RepID=UPI000B3AA557|nr:single-stranded DNA-binding protein [Cloacibacillus sp. An23]OUO93815.1 single-stranded DNA-binding protein [Cloacibacillus sp. An23]
MSRGYNRVVLMGNLARDPDVRFTPTKQKVARITVAIGRQWKNKVTGELQSHTDFVPVAVWGAQADVCERYLRKGRPVLVEGRISVRDFDDIKTGQRRWVTEVVADNIVLLSSGRRDDDQGGYQQQSYGGGQQQYQRAPQSDAMPAPDMGSLRNEAGFEDEFPLDFSELNGPDSSGDVEIPF